MPDNISTVFDCYNCSCHEDKANYLHFQLQSILAARGEICLLSCLKVIGAFVSLVKNNSLNFRHYLFHRTAADEVSMLTQAY